MGNLAMKILAWLFEVTKYEHVLLTRGAFENSVLQDDPAS